MFDIGFAELIIIGVVALIVIGPERLPEAVRTASAWVNRFRRGFNDIKQEVQQELHNDAVLRDLRESGEKLQQETNRLKQEFTGIDNNPVASERETPSTISTPPTPFSVEEEPSASMEKKPSAPTPAGNSDAPKETSDKTPSDTASQAPEKTQTQSSD